MPYDIRCLDLAQYFLGCEGDDGDDTQADLAQNIQDAVEHWFEAREACALRREAAAAWDKCEERRLEAVRLADTLAAVKEHLLHDDLRRNLGPVLRKIDAALTPPKPSSYGDGKHRNPS